LAINEANCIEKYPKNDLGWKIMSMKENGDEGARRKNSNMGVLGRSHCPFPRIEFWDYDGDIKIATIFDLS